MKLWIIVPAAAVLLATGCALPAGPDTGFDEDTGPDGDEWVVVSYPTSGSDPAMMKLLATEEAADEALQDAGVGGIDGNEVGQGTYDLFFVGADYLKMWHVLEPVLKRAPVAWSSVELRRGLEDEHPRVLKA